MRIGFLSGWPISWRIMDSQTDAVFRCLADPIRRHILDLLAEEGALSVSELSNEFPGVVTSNISKHLMSLRATGLVSAARRGRQQIYQLESDALGKVLAPWVAKYERFWSIALSRLRRLSEEEMPRDARSRKRVWRKRGK
jgi:DNA-binding transcriptional ArsR family regulator